MFVRKFSFLTNDIRLIIKYVKYLFKLNFLTLIENAQFFYKKLIRLETCSIIQLSDKKKNCGKYYYRSYVCI